jgi:hypothetical protein
VTYRSPRTTQTERSDVFDLAKFRVARDSGAVEVLSRADRPT